MTTDDKTVAASTRATLEHVQSLLAAEDLVPVRRAVNDAGFGDARCVALVSSVTDDPASQRPLLALKAALLDRLDDGAGSEIERYLLLTAAAQSAPGLADFPVGQAVKEMWSNAITLFGSREGFASERVRREVGHPHFGAMCKVTTLRRFPAGPFDWEVSGFPRSWILAASGRARFRIMRYLLLETRGTRPLFVPHYSVCRKPRMALLEREVMSAWTHMAEAMKLQPAIKGLMAAGWFFSPESHRVTPNLAWINEVFQKHGGCLAELGPESADSGVLQGNRTRQRLYESGEFKPTIGLVLWAREAMLRWAEGGRA